jgi:hypothetical protein
MDTINEAGGKFQSVSEPWADITTHAGKMIMTVFAGIAEFERDFIRERPGPVGKQRSRVASASAGRAGLIPIRHKLQRICSRKASRSETVAKDVQPTRGHDLPLGCSVVTMVSDNAVYQPFRSK